jgi:hypothetical protein
MQYLFYGTLDVLNPRIAEFDYFMTLRANKMIVLLVSVGLLILSEIFTKLVFAYQIALNQQIQRIINCGPAHPVILVFHVDIEGFHIKMAISGIDFFQNGVPLRRFSQLLILKVGRENLFYFLKNFCIKNHLQQRAKITGLKTLFHSLFL